MGEINQQKQDHAVASKQLLERKTTYQVNGKSFIVTPVFRQEGTETLGSVLVKLMRTDHPHEH